MDPYFVELLATSPRRSSTRTAVAAGPAVGWR